MTKYMLKGLVALSVVASLAGTPLAAQDASGVLRLTVRDDSRLWIEGTSNLHAWSCKTTTLDANIAVDPSWERASMTESMDVSKLLRRVDVKVPVQSLKCGNGKMDRIMYEALKSGDAPSISYILGSFDAVPGVVKDTFVVHAVGTLSIAGKENEVRMDVRAERLADGTVRATSEVPIMMTDYGVKPPTALLGTLRTGNRVVVKFELFVGPQTIIAAAAGGSER